MEPTAKPRRVKRDGVCARCAAPLLRGQVAVWDRATQTMRCVVCLSADTDEADDLRPFETGIGGGSARREHDRLMAKRDAAARDKWGNKIGRVVLAWTEAPGSTKAWASGARGEERLAAALDGVDGIRALHDRRVPGTRGNIDHLVVGPSGVFVVDAKNHKGTVRIRDRGGLFRTDQRLYVGSRDWSDLADVDWQVQAVVRVVERLGLEPQPAITPALCFVEADWPLIRPPGSFRSVRLESLKSLLRLVTSPGQHDVPTIDRVAFALAREFPPK